LLANQTKIKITEKECGMLSDDGTRSILWQTSLYACQTKSFCLRKLKFSF
jgi:hypothetical protein